MARNSAATDAGVGQASISTKVKLTIQAVKKCFYFGAVPFFVIPMALFIYYFESPRDFDIAKIHLLTLIADSDNPSKWRMRDSTGERKIITVISKIDNGPPIQYFTPKQIPLILHVDWGAAKLFDLVFFLSLGSSLAGYIVLWKLFAKSGRDQQTNRRIRGAKTLISAQELDSLVRKENISAYSLVDIALPVKAPMQGILVIGTQGSGKSLAFHDFMLQVWANPVPRKCIIYDQSGEFYRAHFREGKDIFFNPACVGSVPWSIFAELKHIYDADTLAEAFLPSKSANGQAGANAFFEDAARSLFSVILLRLAQRGAIDTRDIASAIYSMPDDEMNRLIEKSVASSAMGGDSKGQRQGVISSISIYLNGIGAVGPGNWSIPDFLDRTDDARLFLVGSEDTKAMFAPLFRLILSVSFSAIAARQNVVHDDKYWFFLDEIQTLGDIKVDEQLATLRKYGVSVLAGTQNDSQFVASVGKDRAESIMNGFNTQLQLRVIEVNSMKRAAERLGKLEMETISQNQAVAVVEQRDGAGIVINEQEKWLVMPAEIKQLADCNGYLTVPGAYPTARIDYLYWLPKRPGKKSRIDKFKEKQKSPARDTRFVIIKKVLPDGETAFDIVRREVADAKANEAILAKEHSAGAQRHQEMATETSQAPSGNGTPGSSAATVSAAPANSVVSITSAKSFKMDNELETQKDPSMEP